MLNFEWDKKKAVVNSKKHGVTFEREKFFYEN